MAEIVYGDDTLSQPLNDLVDLFRSPNVEGTLYVGYPILANVDGTVKIDALFISQTSGVVAFDADNLGMNPEILDQLDVIETTQSKYYAALNSKLLETPELLSKRQLAVPISTISLSNAYDFIDDETIVSTIDSVIHNIPESAKLSNQKFRILNSIIERTATIRPKKKRSSVKKQNSKGAILKDLEKSIANLDAWQKRAAIEMPVGPQRIRGLAGSGKTIVLALKAAFLHSKHPEWRIALTFQTRTLYQQFRRLVRQFCFEFSKEEPDWDKLTILHAWGSNSTKGIYSEISNSLGRNAVDFTTAKNKYGAGSSFNGICSELLVHANSLSSITPIYDAILIDEAQDLPQPFFELVFLMTKAPKRIVYAYDELQNLSEYSMMPAEDLFGRKRNGHPNLHVRNEPGQPKRDIVLPVCYRNTPWALSIAHGLGFGTAHSTGIIQMFDEPSLWSEIGYEVNQGQLSEGVDVSLRRSGAATPSFFEGLLTADDAVSFHNFGSVEEEFLWLANSIKKNLTEDELEPDDILVVVPEAISIRSIASGIMRSLRKVDVTSHLSGVTSSVDEVFTPNSVAITSIYRAKGNEAPMIYVVDADYCEGGFNLARKRNVLFTAITRSRAWVRVSGTGSEMSRLIEEYNTIKEDNFELHFKYPTKPELAKIRTLNKDRSSDELVEIRKDLDGIARLARRVQDGEISISSLPVEIQQFLGQLANEAPKPSNSRRKPR